MFVSGVRYGAACMFRRWQRYRALLHSCSLSLPLPPGPCSQALERSPQAPRWVRQGGGNGWLDAKAHCWFHLLRLQPSATNCLPPYPRPTDFDLELLSIKKDARGWVITGLGCIPLIAAAVCAHGHS